VKWLVEHQYGLLLLDLGLGKTACTLKAFDILREAKVVRRALVVAPRRPCYEVWSAKEGGELWRWTDFHHLRVVLLHGPKKDRRLEDDADLYVVNWSGLRWLDESGGFRSLLRRGLDLLVLDEGSKIKNLRTERARAVKPHLSRFARRWLLTGTPESNSLLDVFGETFAVDLGKTFGPYITHFRTQYFQPCGYMGKQWKPHEDTEKKIFKRLKPISLSMRAKDHLDLPSLVERNTWIDLPAKARKAYDELERDLITQLDDGTLTAANAGVASIKCRQVASGGVYREKLIRVRGASKRGRETVHLHDAKTEALVDIVDELQGSPLLVLFEFGHDLERIRKALGRSTPSLDGRTSDKEASRLIVRWNAGKLRVLCGHPASMGHGLNLQRSGHHVCCYSIGWNLELYSQAIKRVHRLGQKKRVIVHRLLARDTVDEAIATALQRKHSAQERLLDALRGYLRRRKI
jgi:SNF2 family DNA or RNA helicase